MGTFLYWLGEIAVVIAILLLVSVPIGFYQLKQKKKKFQNAFSERQPLDAQTFYEKYFRDHEVPADIVIKIRNIFEQVLEADLSRLQAEDDLTQNLSFFFDYDSMAGEELVARLEEEFKINITFAEAQKVKTIEEIVNLVWLKVSQCTA